ncbi:MAG TPA: hypothetical protein VNI20_12375 [Fimbriimonadaceae bacterium]|nr:hypothetical protein [Fimbriimonadaceae bacterium]
MVIAYKIITGLSFFLAFFFVLLVVITSKGDAMSGGSTGVRTSFKGKASFEDKLFVLTASLGAVFLVLMIVLDVLAGRAFPT